MIIANHLQQLLKKLPSTANHLQEIDKK